MAQNFAVPIFCSIDIELPFIKKQKTKNIKVKMYVCNFVLFAI